MPPPPSPPLPHLQVKRWEAQKCSLGGLVHLFPVPEPLALGPLPAVLPQSMTLTAPGDVGCGVPRGRAANAHLHTLGEVLGPGVDADLRGLCDTESGQVGRSLSGQPCCSRCPAPASSPSPKSRMGQMQEAKPPEGLNPQEVAFLGTGADQAAAQATRGGFSNAPGTAPSSLGFCSGPSILEGLRQMPGLGTTLLSSDPGRPRPAQVLAPNLGSIHSTIGLSDSNGPHQANSPRLGKQVPPISEADIANRYGEA